MSAALRKIMTVDEFLAWEQRQPAMHEFDGTAPVARVSAQIGHAAIQATLIGAVGNRLRGSPCRALGSGLKVRTWHTIRYPDAMIVRGPRDRSRSIAGDPVILFEIVSGETGMRDRIEKNLEYRTIPSLQRYVLLEDGGIGAEVFARDNDWAGRVFAAVPRFTCPKSE